MIRKFFYGFMFVAMNICLNAQWVSSNNGLPEKAGPSCFAMKGNILYTGPSEGLFYSTDYGLGWQQKNLNDDRKPFVGTFSFEGSTMLAGGSNCVYASIDEGANWQKIANQTLGGMGADKVMTKCDEFYVGNY